MLLALEGIDGSGKHTQSVLLRQRAESEGLKVKELSFPAYSTNTFGALVGDYLNGEFGSLDQVSPKLSALLYAGDRFESKETILSYLDSSDMLICDRYVPSNLAHQAAKVPRDDQQEFISWLSHIEYGIYGLPRPDLVVYLSSSADTSADLISKKAQRDYTTLKADIHEGDLRYLEACRGCYEIIAASALEPWYQIENLDAESNLRSKADIHEEVWEKVRGCLDHGGKHVGRAVQP